MSSHPVRRTTLMLPLLLLLVWSQTTLAAPPKDGRSWPGFIPLEPALVVNLDNPRRAQYLQLNAQFYVENATDAQTLEHHMPLVRHYLLLHFGGRDPEVMQTSSIREQLRTEALEELQQIMLEHTGSTTISGLYFTGFIVQ
ncbi:flagellar FliL protein [Ectothiorhodospira magna]|uniref:Flagellar protein FliL n=1 Tax=Ectothiorhodospira magna TaxID=867345 RepID=A0A1H9BH97_9GAMM|nr:flagellar basal body-associated FliL family protein [Ectothiorhodospira magna]SEP88354.1 flagellar FliL protein [Ectothiorhodospira magna]